MNMVGEVEASAKVERISLPSKETPVSDELSKLTAILHDICPPDALVGFEFDGRLHVHIQLRRFEDVTRLEVALPSVCGGIFSDVQHGQVGRHSFLHRVSALVAR
jgi:hypothetical protein